MINLSKHPATCVRFDRHVIYLGKPGANQSCPARVFGVADALLVEPAAARTPAADSVDNPVDQRITISARGVTVTAAYGPDRAQIMSILVGASLPRPVRSTPTHPRFRPAALPARATSFTGKGFDTCAAPSSRTMSAWRAHSPYRSIGIYLGGMQRACAQPNLTPSWLRKQTSAGWHFFPIYVGPQFEFNDINAPAKQGTSSATDAVVQAQSLGLGKGSPIYYDMEAYQPKWTRMALTFFTAWTKKLHALGYRSGVYSSSLSGIADLARNFRNRAYVMPDVIYDAWWNGAANTRDPVLPAGTWPSHHRIHQYSGGVNQRFGGITINIDQDFMDIQLVTATAAPKVHISGHWAVTPGGLTFARLAALDGVTWKLLHKPALKRDFRLTSKYLGRKVPRGIRYWVPGHRARIRGHWARAPGGVKFYRLAALNGVTWQMLHVRSLPGDFRLTGKYFGKPVPKGIRFWVPPH